MLKYILLLSVLTTLIVAFASNDNYYGTFAQTSSTPSIKSVTLDKDKVVGWCPIDEGIQPKEGEFACSKKESLVNISTQLTNESEEVEYYYIVSSGKITGNGKNVTWQFRNSIPGKYTITIGIGKDGIIIGETITKTVELFECYHCDPPQCECPTIKFNPTPKQVKEGDTFVLSVETQPSDLEIVRAKWTIQGGEIIAGQGMTKVLVKVSDKPQKNMLTATVETETECEDCTATFAEEIRIVK